MSEGKEILHDLFSSVNQSVDLIAERFVKIEVASSVSNPFAVETKSLGTLILTNRSEIKSTD